MSLALSHESEVAQKPRRRRAIEPALWRRISPARRWALVWPREHGAWGILLVSLISGAAAGFSSVSSLPRLLWLTLAATAAFCLRTPLGNSLPASPFRARGSGEQRWVAAAASVYALTFALAVGMLLSDGALDLLWKPALVAAGLFALQALVKRWGRAERMLSEIIAAFGLAVVAAAAWAVAAGRFGSEALALWLMNGLFATNQILYVQFRINEMPRTKSSSHSGAKLLFLAGECLTVVVLIAGWRFGLIPGLALLAFLPILVRGGIWSINPNHPPLQIRRVGKAELAHAILFGVLVIVGFRWFVR